MTAPTEIEVNLLWLGDLLLRVNPATALTPDGSLTADLNHLMHSPYKQPHWDRLTETPYLPAGPVGFAPAEWVLRMGLTHLPSAPLPLPTTLLDRSQVRSLCQAPGIPVLFGYLCVMAWGAQGAGMGGGRNARAAWEQRTRIEATLNRIRHGGLSRKQAYALFQGAGEIFGLGPAYWTKLLYFFSPTPTSYVMDQWTSKSVNLLTGRVVVPLVNGSPAKNNPADCYEEYCRVIDSMAVLLGLSGDQVEEKLMSRGGRNPAPWRAHVRRHFPKAT